MCSHSRPTEARWLEWAYCTAAASRWKWWTAAQSRSRIYPDRLPTIVRMLDRIEEYLNAAPARACEIETLGPVRLFFHRESDHPFLSYARPAAPLGARAAEEIAAVRAAFARRGRLCR